MKASILLPFLICIAPACNKGDKASQPDEATKAKPAVQQDKALSDTPPAAKPIVEKTPENTAKVKDFVSEEDKFSVAAVREPRIDKSVTATAAGNIKLTTYMFNAQGAQGAYGVMVSELPFSEEAGEADRIKAIGDAEMGLVTKYSATLTNKKDFKIGGNHGREFDLSATHPQMGKMSGHYKLVIRNNNLYQVMRIGSPDAAELIAEGDALVSSFTLTK